MWFSDLAGVQNPGRLELQRFVDATQNFLGFVLETPEFGFLWEDDADLAVLALETFNGNVRLSAGRVTRGYTEHPTRNSRFAWPY